MSLLSIDGVEVKYTSADGSNLTAVSEVSFSAESQEFITVIGPSGCGKSTLLHCLGGLQRPTQGTITINGREMDKPDPRVASFVFQEYSLLPWKNVIDNAAIGLTFGHVPKAKRQAVAREALALVGLEGSAHAYPRELSGGMQQRVAVARAMAMEPDILLMDEPFGALDEQTRRALGLEMTKVLTDRGTTVVMVTHSLDEAIFWGDRILVISARPGRIVKELRVTEPRPRAVEFIGTSAFTELRAELLGLLTDARHEHPGKESAPADDGAACTA